MDKPRSAAGIGTDFPYASKLVCYVEITTDGDVSYGTPDRQAVERAHAGTSRLFAVWPGQWSSQLFAIDDLDECARALGFVHDGARTGLADHNHDVVWAISRFESKPLASYISVDVTMRCGCAIKDLRTFADHMRRQRGWDVATSSGWGSSRTPEASPTYSVRIRRRSLDS